jgi:segregation and condensation protein A
MQESAELIPEHASKGHRFHINDFEGPLDLLLFLIKKNEVSIYDIPISAITEQFLAFLDQAQAMDLDGLTEFYSFAATLLYIKSRMLLPVDINLNDEIEDPARTSWKSSSSTRSTRSFQSSWRRKRPRPSGP